MSLAELRLESLRCLGPTELQLDERLNLLVGDNGSGKTSLLEAIYLLGRGRSFRTRHTAHLIRHGAARFWVQGRTAPEPGHMLGVECDREGGVHVRIDRTPVASRVELSEFFPVQVIDPGIHRLVEEGPAPRRRWLDWAVFHVEPNFIRDWQGYSRALRQRNAALHSGTNTEPWDEELSRLGERLTAARARLIDALQSQWPCVLADLGVVPASLGFFQGWSRTISLAESLRSHHARDRDRGLTSIGPHRFDVLLRVDGRPAREVVSRGQQKLLGIAMAVTMARYLSEAAGRTSTLLLDDPAAELDAEHTDALLRTAVMLGAQLIVTSLKPNDSRLGSPNALFHVERGRVQRL